MNLEKEYGKMEIFMVMFFKSLTLEELKVLKNVKEERLFSVLKRDFLKSRREETRETILWYPKIYETYGLLPTKTACEIPRWQAETVKWSLKKCQNQLHPRFSCPKVTKKQTSIAKLKETHVNNVYLMSYLYDQRLKNMSFP